MENAAIIRGQFVINESNYSHVVPRKLLVVQLIRLWGGGVGGEGEQTGPAGPSSSSSLKPPSRLIALSITQPEVYVSEFEGNDAVN